MKRFLPLVFVVFAFAGFAQVQSPCDSPKAHEFDFWIGEWTVYKNGTDQVVGQNTITQVVGGCGLQENWRGGGGNVGTSLNKYAFRKGKWQQFWIDNSGQTLELEGNLEGANMVMTGSSPAPQGKSTMNKITWFNNADGSVRQLWEQSSDGGTTWTSAFDGLYKKSKP